eukprot:3842360-Rhodomonas_salina.1
MTEQRSSEKVTVFNGQHESWPAASSKFIADAMTNDIQRVPWSADNNPPEIRKMAKQLKPADEATQLKNQARFYGKLVKSIADHCSEIQYQNAVNIAKASTIINLSNFCLSFKGSKWLTYYGGAERLINLFKATSVDGKLTVDDMAMVMMLQGMILAGGQWSTLTTMMLTDETLTLETMRARAYNHLVNFGLENGTTIDVNTTNTLDKTKSQSSDYTVLTLESVRDTVCKEIIEVLATEGGARGSQRPKGKGCWLHCTKKHTAVNCNVLKEQREKDLCLKCGSDDGHHASDCKNGINTKSSCSLTR